jgi:hypothetical protein
MSKNSGYLVETKSGKQGRTYHCEGLINKKMVVHIDIDGKNIKMLCDPKTVKIIGFVD